MNDFAEHLLIAIPCCSLIAMVLAISALRLRVKAAVRVLILAKVLMFVAAAASIRVLDRFIAAFLADDFSIPSVARYSSTDQLFLYKLSAVWAAPAGVLLLLSVGVLVIFALWLVTFKTDGSLFNATAVFVGASVSVAFSAVVLFVARPFARSLARPADGAGLSPLLQNVWMLVHPPAFLLAYSAWLIPFLVVITAVFVRRTNDIQLLGSMRRWLLAGIGFMTLGIVTGIRWAYLELSWGGYWSWEPIQSLSLLPWLAALLALHSLNAIDMADEFRRWTLLLGPAPFVLSLFLAYVDVSGILPSAHSFGGGVFSSAFLALAVACLFLWFIAAARVAKSLSFRPTEPSRFRLDRVRILLWAGVAFIAIGSILGLATFLPIILKKITTYGRLFMPKPSFYRVVVQTAGVVLAFVVGLYRVADLQQRRRGSLLPTLGACAAGFICFGVLYNVFAKSLYFNCLAAICCFSGVAVLIKLCLDVVGGRKMAGDLTHLGVVMLVASVGLAGTGKSVQTQLATGKKLLLSGWQFTYVSFETSSSRGVKKAGPRIAVSRDRIHFELWPHHNTYPGTTRPRTRSQIAIQTRIFEDVGVSFDGLGPDGTVRITARVRPGMFWLWLSAAVVIVGIMLAAAEGKAQPEPVGAMPPRRPRRKGRARQRAERPTGTVPGEQGDESRGEQGALFPDVRP